jgi:branched-chain amino acid transport system permease protein
LLQRRKERVDRGIKARSSDVFALSSWREMLYLSAPRLLPIVGLLLLSVVLSYYWQRVLLSVSVFALLAISWDILAQSGMVSLGQALFFGTGAYLAGNMNHYLGWLAPLCNPPAGGYFWGPALYAVPYTRFTLARNLFFNGHAGAAADAGPNHRGHTHFWRHRRP